MLASSEAVPWKVSILVVTSALIIFQSTATVLALIAVWVPEAGVTAEVATAEVAAVVAAVVAAEVADWVEEAAGVPDEAAGVPAVLRSSTTAWTVPVVVTNTST